MSWLAQMHARRLVLELREILVRFDENQKAAVLLDSCVPYLCDGDPEIERARADQAAMVAHLESPDVYAAYYAANVHERPFEEQYRIEAGQAHEHLPRVAILREELARKPVLTLLDCACNDGWMAANLFGLVGSYHGIDLNPGCIERARARNVPDARFMLGDVHDAPARRRLLHQDAYDMVIAFELIEHVPDPDRLLVALTRAVRPGGRVLISTPCGATENGELAAWWHVEPKGHVRVFTPESFGSLLARHGEISFLKLGGDGVMVAEIVAGA